MSHDFRDKNSIIPEFVPATNRWQRAGETLGSRLARALFTRDLGRDGWQGQVTHPVWLRKNGGAELSWAELSWAELSCRKEFLSLSVEFLLKRTSIWTAAYRRCRIRFVTVKYLKIPIISPRLVFVQKAFLLGLFCPGELIFGPGGINQWKSERLAMFSSACRQPSSSR